MDDLMLCLSDPDLEFDVHNWFSSSTPSLGSDFETFSHCVGTEIAGDTSDQYGSTESASLEHRSQPPSSLGALTAPPPPKIGARFSRDTVRTLRTWLTNHSQHPFPTEKDCQRLQRQTGLSKTQITVWIGNARRRGKVSSSLSQQKLSTKPSNTTSSLPQRPGTPALRMEHSPMNPLQLWIESPPEHEPATASAIARAMESGSPPLPGLDTPHGFPSSLDGTSTPLSYGSSASSLALSHSSAGSTYSFGSNDTTASLRPVSQSSRRHKRRAMNRHADTNTSLLAPRNTYQCTFCTETFKTKHNWQRHERSLHLPLDRWSCAPNGPRQWDEENVAHCSFCGQANPDDNHIESHNYSTCKGRTLEERTFTRKDHLRQHLRLVHNVNLASHKLMLSEWKGPTPEIRSTCGFCGTILESWDRRADHLSDHFKMGTTMADWTGDWGFEDHILARLENAIPPYLIHTEQNAPFPFEASAALTGSPRNAYELIEVEMAHYIQVYFDKHQTLPTSDQKRLEACRIIFASEALSYEGQDCSESWLRDLIMSSETIAREARLAPIRSTAEGRLAILQIIGQSNLFESCPLEAQLQEYVGNHTSDSSYITAHDLQQEAVRIIRQFENQSMSRAAYVADWLVEMALSSIDWLDAFRIRTHMTPIFPTSNQGSTNSSADPSRIESIMNNYAELERRLVEYVEVLSAHQIIPDDRSLRQQMGCLINEFADEDWKKVAVQNDPWLTGFKRRHHDILSGTDTSSVPNSTLPSQAPARHSVATIHARTDTEIKRSTNLPELATAGHLYPHNSNLHRWMALELGRWARSMMSPNNPNQHVPTDQELQHQARWILYDDGDPWNQTPADNTEWLQRFKRDLNIP